MTEFKAGQVLWRPDYQGDVNDGLAIQCVIIQRLVEDEGSFRYENFIVDIDSCEIIETNKLRASVGALRYLPGIHRLYETKEEAQLDAIKDRRDAFSLDAHFMDQIQAMIEERNDD